MELHRAVGTSLQTLSHHHNLLVGALRSCDAPTQQAMLEEHRALVAAAVESLVRLGTFIEQCKIVPADARQRDSLVT